MTIVSNTVLLIWKLLKEGHTWATGLNWTEEKDLKKILITHTQSNHNPEHWLCARHWAELPPDPSHLILTKTSEARDANKLAFTD